MKPKVVVIGAGIAGLSAALHLLRTGEFDVDVFEKNDRVGGLATSFSLGPATFDFGPHAFHSQHPPVIDFFTGLMRGQYNEIHKNVAIKFEERLYPYPLNPAKAMINMPLHRSARCAASYFFNLMFNHASPESLKTSEEFFIRNFGRQLYRIFFENYTHKVWGIHPRDLSAAFIKNRLPPASLLKIAISAITGRDIQIKKPHEVPLKLRIFYPKKGSIQFPQAMAQEIIERGGRIVLNTALKKIGLQQGRVANVTLTTPDKDELHACDYLISTIPITQLIGNIDQPMPPETKAATQALQFRPILIACLWINKPEIFPYQTIYYTNRLFNRLAQMNSYSSEVIPTGTSGVTAEMTCEIGDALWHMPERDVLNNVIRDMEKEGLISASDVKEGMLLRSPHGYPIYRNGFEPHLMHLRETVRNIPNLFTGGRQGMFNYAQMHYGVTSGQLIAQNIFEGKTKPTGSPQNMEDAFFT